MRLPRSLFGRTAVLIASALALFCVVAWQVTIWSAIEPAAALWVNILAQRAHDAEAARATAAPLPPGTRFEHQPPPVDTLRFHGLAFGGYVETIRRELQVELGSPDVRITRLVAPSEVWVEEPTDPNLWLVLSWRVASPKAPLAAASLLCVAALVVLGAAAFSARRLTAPLAALAGAAARLAEGQKVDIDIAAGPTEVRSLAVAFQSMSHRLAELDEQRELMLGGISHDLRTPLARLRVAVELLDREDPLLLEEMAASIEEMDGMIGQFLYFVRANYREVPMLASLDDVVRATLGIYATDERLRLELSADTPRCFGVECIKHTVLNLVQNALEYGAPPVTVATHAASDAVAITVTDRGAGLTAMQWEEALRPFHRLSPMPNSGHTGLGLALVDRLIRSGGGTWHGRQTEDGFVIEVRLPAS
jgi:two-component system osmolarity sensor histidine kinase EnvZ